MRHAKQNVLSQMLPFQICLSFFMLFISFTSIKPSFDAHKGPETFVFIRVNMYNNFDEI